MMNGKIKRIDSITNMAVFQDFRWDSSVRDAANNVVDFQAINILYGRNYSGKTTLSRIVRAMETGKLSDKFDHPSFSLTFSDGTNATQNTLPTEGKKIRVFNEDFVRDNLRFITNPDDSIEPFAIFGEDNNKIEKELDELERELGSPEGGAETGLYAQRVKATSDHVTAKRTYETAQSRLDSQLRTKATDREVGIKYKPERFGNQNYDIRDISSDIKTVKSADYQPPTDDQLTQYEDLITEKPLPPITQLHTPSLNISTLADEAEVLVSRKVSESDKIAELVKDAVLNRWVSDGRVHHKSKRDHCAFCGNLITEDRWKILDKHFDEESEKLERDIEGLITRITSEKDQIASALSIAKDRFYSKFHARLDELDSALQRLVGTYVASLNALTTQLKARKDDILNPHDFEKPPCPSADWIGVWTSYEAIRSESNSFSNSLSREQEQAKRALRLKEVYEYLITIEYSKQLSAINTLNDKRDQTESEKNRIERDIRHKEQLIVSKKRELHDEEKGAKKVNEYLNNFFGHQFLTLEAQAPARDASEDSSKRIRFEVIRDGKKAYHLSEGECSLLAFCYFLAKLDDIATKNSKPIIWIDDPISSLDGNHIFFVYSLLNAEIVARGKFEQLFLSTHNLDFLKYLKRLKGKYIDAEGRHRDYPKAYFIVARQDRVSTITVMPKYLKEYVTEFNYLFHQIHQCAAIEAIDDTNYTTFYNFANNTRKFFEIYLYYKYPDQGMTEETLRLFFGDERIPAILMDRINNEYSHLSGVFERGATPVEVPEMQTAAREITERLKQDEQQYSALLKSVGAIEEPVKGVTAQVQPPR